MQHSALLFTLILALTAQFKTQAEPVKMLSGPSPADNPLKGLVPYANPGPGSFPHSLEFGYLRFSDLMTGPDSHNWQDLEKLLNGVASRGNQTIFRIWIEYPGRESGLPQFLCNEGVKVTDWKNDDEKAPNNICHTPDYEDERLIRAMENLIAALGKRYDGDPRIGYITAGLLGSWGEWHTFPREDLFASVKPQQRVLDAYEKAFTKTQVLLRYPAGEGNQSFASNANRPFGYHDDSFAWGTLETGRKENGWYYMPSLKAAGDAALNKWRTHPIGGEVRPEVWGQIHDAKPEHKNAQDFTTCVEQTHVTWLMESGIFQTKPEPERRERALADVRRMGYDFQVQSADITCDGNRVKIRLSVINQGVAPFYQDWSMELATLDQDGHVIQRWPLDWKITGLFPKDPAREWQVAVDLQDLAAKGQCIALRVINPLKNGKPLRFANANQDRDAPGWLSLGQIP